MPKPASVPGRAAAGHQAAGGAEVTQAQEVAREEQAPFGPVTRADIDQLDEALEMASRSLRAVSKPTDRVYAVYNRSLADVIAGRASAAAGSLSVLQAAQAELG
jgi:hypothetical protein